MVEARLVQGNEACALGAIAAGATFYAGYPITPSTEIAEQMSALYPKKDGKFIQMEDEIASIGAIIGASCAGAKAFTATSGPGFSLMQELIGYAAMTEVPIVIVDVMRAGPSTGLPTLSSQGDIQQARWGTHGDHSIIALAPASVEETYLMTIDAFNFAEKYRTPVILLLDEIIGHLKERFLITPDMMPPIINRQKPQAGQEFVPYKNTQELIPALPDFGEGSRYHVTGLTHNEQGFYSSKPEIVESFINRINAKIEDNSEEIFRCNGYNVEDCEVLLIAYGSISRSAEEAMNNLRREGINVGLLRPQTIWPLNEALIGDACCGKKAVIIPEMNLGQYAREIERCAPDDVPVVSLPKVDGTMIFPSEIEELVREVLK
ncbi:MAG: 2-oxoacid:acceptor oxidoreductase subunit alpha [Clostridia bacterium]|nr:2-oxoacid:acceptor oxidoreductase subunit alpha [Clostridia bacterium]MDD4799277.1 2-oxoacid:acceptor oxidoreductase subunit alpha [Clostridia bacterium]